MWRRRLEDLALFVGGGTLGLIAVAFFAPLDSPETQLPIPGTVVLDANGTVLQRDTAAGLRIPVSRDQIAPFAIEATIAAEDSRFESHPGVDPIAIARASLDFPRERSGASTITQQLARQLYLDGQDLPVLLRKAREMVAALQLEARYSKDEILEDYLNVMYYGRGAYGIEAAARVYFGVSARNLNLAQSAMLAGLPQIPSLYDPATDPQPARQRQRYVLDRMAAEGMVTAEASDEAYEQQLHFLPALDPPIAPHFVQFALDELARLRPDLAAQPGLIVETTLDASLQREAERSVTRRLEDLADKSADSAAVVVLDPATGRIRAMVGSADFNDDRAGQVNMALALRQPGSALKPFLYAGALERGYTAASPLLDVPTTFDTPSGHYAPQNYDRRFHGVVPLRTALASSFNVPAVQVLNEIGIDSFLETAHLFGLQTLTNTEAYGLALTLGGGEVRLLDLTAAYGALANSGALVELFAVLRVRDHAGNVLYERPAPAGRQATSPQIAYVISDILSDPDARISGFGPVTPFSLPSRAAVKTGTTTGWRDNWTVGFTASAVVGVWVGNADGSSMQDVSGVDGAGPIWRDVMMASLKTGSAGWIERPDGIIEATVCNPTGLLPGPDCPSPSLELFVAGTEPIARERYYERAADGRLLVKLPVAARAWAADAGVALTAPAGDEGSGVSIVQPGSGSVVYLAPELKDQHMLLRATVPPGADKVDFSLDGTPLGTTGGADASLVWRLEPGSHVLEVTVTSGDGRTLSTSSRFEVRAP